jgi:hypothetical protein
MTEKKQRYRQDGIYTLEDLKSRCKVDDMTGCLVWQGSTIKSGGAVWLPALKQARSVTGAFNFLKPDSRREGGKHWIASCGNSLCADESHRVIGTLSDAMRAVRPTLTPQHRAKIAATTRKNNGKHSNELAAYIRSSTESTAALAKFAGLHESTICKIRSGEMWASHAVNSSVFTWRPAA